MKLQEEQAIYIREAFNSMKSKEDFLSLLNYCKVIVFGAEAIPFGMRQLNYHCNPKNNKARYYSFSIRKKSGAFRTIHAPNKGLKAIQKCLNLILQVIFEPHKAATGFIPDKSVVDNAKVHTGKNYVYNIDLKDFFPSIEKARLYSRLKFPPFNLDNERYKLANIIAGLCCQEMEVERIVDEQWIKKMEYVLPQGAPTSPTLTNIICERLDRRLFGAAKKNGLSYSRYADDITFSSNHNKYQKDGEFLKEVERIISDQNFIIKTDKTRLQKKGYRQEVTGLLVNKDVNVQKRYIKELRMWLYYWEQYGYERAYEFFLPRYKAEKAHVKKGKPNLANVIKGKLDYLKMVKGSENRLCSLLSYRFTLCLDMELGLNLSKEALRGDKENEIMSALKRTFEKHNELIEEKQVATKKINEAKSLTQRIIEKDLKETHNPRRLTELLNQFTLDSSPLKYATHPLETSSQFNNFDSFIYTFQEDMMIELKQLKSDLWNYLIYPFLYQKDDEVWLDKDNKLIDTYCWGEAKFKLGWKYKNLLKEMFEKQLNLGYIKFPLSTKIDKQFIPEDRVSGKYLTTWNDFVEVFKNEIEFRYNKLEELIFDITNPLRTNFNNNIEIVGLSGLNFYTYTSNINKALQILISPYNSYANAISPKLIIKGEYDQKGKVITIKIINEGSFWDAILDESIDKVHLSSGKGQLKGVKDLLYGLCDWSLESRFRVKDEYKYCRFNYLGKKYKILPREIDIEPIIGHTHILTFCV